MVTPSTTTAIPTILARTTWVAAPTSPSSKASGATWAPHHPFRPNSYGCCSEVGLPGSGDDIGSLPGNKAAVDDDTPGVAYYIDNGLVGFVPIWDYAFGNGNPDHAGYHIIGYAGFQLVHVDGA